MQVCWEPIVEPWNVSCSVAQKHTNLPCHFCSTSIKISSSAKLNINVTESLVQVPRQAWEVHLGSYVSQGLLNCQQVYDENFAILYFCSSHMSQV
jgi:hypothetical protein